jgi:cell wall-associated NlpC family hydrolase
MTLTRQRHDGTSQFSNHSQETPAVLPNPSFDGHSFFIHTSVTRATTRAVQAAIAIAAAAVIFSTPVSAKPKPLVGVHGWTSGSQTFLRSRPGAQTAPVAKVPRHTRLYVWGTFNGWYRVETSDNKFGWVHHKLLNAPNADKLVELSHRKAKLASDRVSNQLRLAESTQDKASSSRKIRVAAESRTQSSTRLRNRKAIQSGSDSQGNVKVAATKSRVVKTIVSTVPVKKVTTVKATPIKAVVVKAAPAKAALVKKQDSAKAREQRLAAMRQIEKREAADRAERQRLAKVNAERLAAVQAEQRAAAQAQAKREAQIRLANAQAEAKAEEAAKQARIARAQAEAKAQEAARKVRVARLERERQQRAANYKARQARLESQRQARLAARQKRLAASQARERQRQQLLAQQRSQAAQASASANPQALAEGLRPLSPDELMRAREEYLRERSSQPGVTTGSNALDATTSPLQMTPSAFSFNSSSLPTFEVRTMVSAQKQDLGARPVGQYVEVPGVQATAQSQTAAKTPVLASRGGYAGMRGGSPRDYARATQKDGSLFGQTLAKQALAYRGRPYIMGAASPSRGFDCSGLIYFLLRQRGYNPPRTAAVWRVMANLWRAASGSPAICCCSPTPTSAAFRTSAFTWAITSSCTRPIAVAG